MKRILILTAFFLGFIRVGAQIPLRIFPDTISTSVALGDTIPFFAGVINNDTTNVYIGNLSFNYSINGSLFTSSDDSSGVEFDTAFAAIVPGDTIVKNIVVHVSPPKFSTGPSVVVIWPKAYSGSSAYAKDSLVLLINVTPALGITNLEDNRIKLYVLSNAIWIEKGGEIQLRRVRIFDVLGQAILDKPNPSDNIPLPGMNRGIYMAEVTYNNNLRKVFRFYY